MPVVGSLFPCRDRLPPFLLPRCQVPKAGTAAPLHLLCFLGLQARVSGPAGSAMELVGRLLNIFKSLTDKRNMGFVSKHIEWPNCFRVRRRLCLPDPEVIIN